MFVKKTEDLSKHALKLVRHISVPKAHSLLGIHPILSMICQTDESPLVIEKLKTFRSSENEKRLVLSVVQYCLHSSIYPHDKTVWVFNDPQNEVVMLESYLDGETVELEDMILLHNDTYPFIAIEEHSTDLPLYKNDDSKKRMRTDLSRPREKKELPLRENESSHRTTPTVLVPTLALGSLYMLSKLANED